MSPRPFVPGTHVPLPPADADSLPLDRAIADSIPPAVTVQLTHELPNGPTRAHIGRMVARVTLDAMVVAKVASLGAEGNDVWVELSDGTRRRRDLGQWFVVSMGGPS